MIIFSGSGCFIVISFLLALNGVTEYDGTMNTTYLFNASTNTTLTTQTPNYSTDREYLTTGMAAVFILAGLYGMFYGATLPPKTGITE